MRFTWLLLFFAFIGANAVYAQTCPDNIDFSYGNFTNWECQTGKIDLSGVITFSGRGPVVGRQTIINNQDTGKDPYGNFSVVSPSGNKYSIRLGNDIPGAQAEQVSYTYTIPADKTDYVFTYYYAVVLQLTNHKDYERPRFSVKLTDLTAKEIVPCGTHDFVSGDGLGDFQRSSAGQVEYRDWSTVAVNLGGRAGHTVRFDFTTNDCVYVAHFGYAYLAFDDPCLLNKNPIAGSNICRGANGVTLTAPPGFGSYSWHQANSTDIIGSGRQLKITPVPKDGTQFGVDVVSTSGVGAGCAASFAATVHKIDEEFNFVLQPSVSACDNYGADLTDPKLIAGSSNNLTYKYYSDADGNSFVRNPKSVTQSGSYYIRATNVSGCTDVQRIDVTIIPSPSTQPVTAKPVCRPFTVDITDPSLVSIDPTNTYEYFKDVNLSQPVANPKAIDVAGVYFVKITNMLGCVSAVPVTVTIIEIPVVNPKTVTGCAPLNIANLTYSTGDQYVATYQYFKDAAAKVPLDHPEAITQSGIYYALGFNTLNCPAAYTAPVTVNISAPASITLNDLNPVKYPNTIDLSAAVNKLPGYTYSYFADSLATTPLADYARMTKTGRYFVKATNEYGCEIIRGINISINDPDEVTILFNNTFTPNSDGVNDEFNPRLQGVANINYLKIYSRNGALVFSTTELGTHWDGRMNGAELPQGTYYWVCEMYDIYRKKRVIRSGYIALLR